jgi:hypothetical protein
MAPQKNLAQSARSWFCRFFVEAYKNLIFPKLGEVRRNCQLNFPSKSSDFFNYIRPRDGQIA